MIVTSPDALINFLDVDSDVLLDFSRADIIGLGLDTIPIELRDIMPPMILVYREDAELPQLLFHDVSSSGYLITIRIVLAISAASKAIWMRL